MRLVCYHDGLRREPSGFERAAAAAEERAAQQLKRRLTAASSAALLTPPSSASPAALIGLPLPEDSGLFDAIEAASDAKDVAAAAAAFEEGSQDVEFEDFSSIRRRKRS
ncbi:hypothetical protein MY11210_002990 [Beauveria gryllotalpidicola]